MTDPHEQKLNQPTTTNKGPEIRKVAQLKICFHIILTDHYESYLHD